MITLPGVHNGNTIINDHITALDGAVGNEGEVGLALLEGNGPVNKVELYRSATKQMSERAIESYIEVVKLELSKAGIQRSLDDFRTVLAIWDQHRCDMTNASDSCTCSRAWMSIQ